LSKSKNSTIEQEKSIPIETPINMSEVSKDNDEQGVAVEVNSTKPDEKINIPDIIINDQKEKNETKLESKDFRAAIDHLKQSGHLVIFPSKDLKAKIYIPQTLVNSFKVLFRHDLHDHIFKMPRTSDSYEKEQTSFSQHNFELEATKVFESGHMSPGILELLYKHRLDKHALPLNELLQLITSLGLGTMSQDGTLLVPSVINNDIQGFEKWMRDRNKKAKIKETGMDLLRAEFFFDHGGLSIGVCEAILVGLERNASVKFTRSFRAKFEDRRAGTVYIAHGRLSNNDSIFIREDEIAEQNEQFIRRRSVTLLIKPKISISDKTCQQFLNVIRVTHDTIQHLQIFEERKQATMYSCRILCNDCEDDSESTSLVKMSASPSKAIGYFDWKNYPWTDCFPRAIHFFDEAFPELANYAENNEELVKSIIFPSQGASSKQSNATSTKNISTKGDEEDGKHGMPSRKGDDELDGKHSTTIEGNLTASGDIRIGTQIELKQKIIQNVADKVQIINLHVDNAVTAQLLIGASGQTGIQHLAAGIKEIEFCPSDEDKEGASKLLEISSPSCSKKAPEK